MISGVCAGIAEYFDVDPTLVRLLAVILLVLGNAATFIVYIVLAVVVPEAPADAAPRVEPAGSEAASEAETNGGNTTASPAAQPDDPSPAADDPPAAPPVPETPPTPTPEGTPRARHVSGGITAGLVLIAVGAIMLVARFVPDYGWWNLWPLIIVFAGIAQALTPGHHGWSIERFFDGLVTVAVGGVFLAITFGYVGWGVWWRVLSLWPVLLVAIGLGILGGAVGQNWIKALGSVVVIAALAYSVSVSVDGAPSVVAAGGEAFEFSEPVDGAQTAELTLKAGVGEVDIADGDQLATAEGRSPFGRPSFEVVREGDTASVAFSLGDSGSYVAWPGAPGARTEMKLGRDVDWDVSIESGVSTVDADLSDVELRSLDLKTGVSDASVRLGDVAAGTDVATIEVESGVSAVTVLVPDGVEVRVEADTGLVALEIDSSLESIGGRVWKSDGYDEARSRGDGVYDVRVSSGVGSVAVRRY